MSELKPYTNRKPRSMHTLMEIWEGILTLEKETEGLLNTIFGVETK